MRTIFKLMVKNIIIGAVPSAYLFMALFIITLTGTNVFAAITLMKVIGFILSVKIVTIDFAMSEYLYKDRRERLTSFLVNTFLLGMGLTVFNFS